MQHDSHWLHIESLHQRVRLPGREYPAHPPKAPLSQTKPLMRVYRGRGEQPALRDHPAFEQLVGNWCRDHVDEPGARFWITAQVPNCLLGHSRGWFRLFRVELI